jgi:hypothetical protein
LPDASNDSFAAKPYPAFFATACLAARGAWAGCGFASAAARRFDRGARTLGNADRFQHDLALDLSGQDDLRVQRQLGDDPRCLQGREIDGVRLDLGELVQAHFRGIAPHGRHEAALGQPAMERHLPALEADLVIAARARFLALVAASRGFTETAAYAATDAPFRVLGAGGRLDLVEFH